jgi:hypothetical protein
MKAKQPKAYQEKKGYRGKIESLDMYEQLKEGKISWKDNVRSKLKSIEIPTELFFRLMELDITVMDKCSFPDGIEIRPDGEHPVDPCTYVTKEIHRNVTVTVSECKNCGSIDISWERQDDTESEYMGGN